MKSGEKRKKISEIAFLSLLLPQPLPVDVTKGKLTLKKQFGVDSENIPKIIFISMNVSFLDS